MEEINNNEVKEINYSNEKINYHNNLENLHKVNKNKLEKLKLLLQSLDKIEANIKRKIDIRQKYVETLKKTFKQSVNSYHTICKNLTQ